MITVDELKKAHDEIEEELKELDVIMSEEVINYPNLIHVLKKIAIMWDSHEKEEEELFRKLTECGYSIPYDNILIAHGRLNRYWKNIKKALESGSEQKVRGALESAGLKLVNKLREHIRIENEILYRLPEDCCDKLRQI